MSAPNVTEPRRWGKSGHSDPVARAAAVPLRLRPSYVEQLMRGPTAVNVRCAEIVRAFIRLQDFDRLARFMRPIDDALAGLDRPKLDAPLILTAVREDGEKDLALTALELCPNEATAKAFLREGDQAITAMKRVLQAVADKYGIAR